MRSRLLLVIVLACVALNACGLPSNSVNGKIIKHVLSPNGMIDALVTRSTGGDATVSATFRVYLETKSNGLKYQIMQADHVFHPIEIKWDDKNHLLIGIPCANIFSYTNYFDFMKNGILSYQVSIELQNYGLCSVYLSKEEGSSESK